ncbi:hypothetical protein KP509_28G019700 [Ceratopteris richardii]|uniref:Uncharacterized protein n=1 Tax=Ceratopteris richardii TaxID=49495 RepID=A0A8T2RA56_CERRI|nr:hypothetical protein KP509_28G019700 [Ceratopteris richardii]
MPSPAPSEGASNGDHTSCPTRCIVESIIIDFEDATRDAANVQRRVLEDILSHNARTEYLYQRCGLQGRIDLHAFKERVPLVTHSDLKPYFDRIADGDENAILTADPVRTLSLSSGTTSDGQHKLLILYKEILEASGHISKIAAAYRHRAFPTRFGCMFLELVFCGRLSYTRGGLPSGTATTHLFRSKEFKQKQKVGAVRACSPEVVVRHSDNRQAMYCHLLCALLCREQIEFITATFAYTIVEAFHTLQLEWKNLCADIGRGELTSWITDKKLRAAISDLMPSSDPQLAKTIAAKCSASTSWAGIIPDLWPNCKYIYSIMTGSMEHYINQLQQYAGSLPLVSADYGSTESWIGVNANPKAAPRDVIFTVVPSFAFFEFIPVKHSSWATSNDKLSMAALQHTETDLPKEPSPVMLTEVEVGKEYEVVLTTYGGLYRYRLGDIVKVTSFFNATPQLAYVCRKNVLLSVHIDKNSEKDLQIAVEEALKELQKHVKAELVDFTSYANLSRKPGHYVVFWELRKRDAVKKLDNEHEQKCLASQARHMLEERSYYFKEEILRDCATCIDAAFVDPGYVGSRKVKTIGPLELCLVEPGTFRGLLNRYLERGTAGIAQYKTPRCITSQEMIEILRKCSVCSVRSSAYA